MTLVEEGKNINFGSDLLSENVPEKNENIMNLADIFEIVKTLFVKLFSPYI